ncbi:MULTISPECIES: GNAT family N-acetyltransferase [Maribacter]|uniref:GNAT family N-acetyltransferase n=1 Tax=Maribacter flavus TaxID=1658664 RepID=A0A5B2TRR0_9FLAO|nr:MULTISPECIES: GNAT family N-acetyltransferase [Maribacter]KAA2217341.1 GNAT family N-acetyltransferase [Maribacter flavus]MDC6405777.1 GNAT family N-acetyltransferase [Maribacter sp. PR66]MEE1972971.1 GNAT family N-acetyltransferase [Maribacter flavus]
MLEIIAFEAKYKDVFRDLNLAWLERFFYVEDKDHELLNDCQTHILDKGGLIFIGLWNQKPVSCYSLLKKGGGIYELGKMAVEVKHQSLKIGQQMLAHAIALGKRNQWERIELYSSTILKPALHIYRKFGFREVILENNSPYARSDIKMELLL